MALILTGCGYVGPVVPPSPEIPNPIADLSVVERGTQLDISFTAPARTTDNFGIRQFSDIDLRIGPASTKHDPDEWASAAKQYEVPTPAPNDPNDPEPRPVKFSLPAADWQGQTVSIGVRTSVKNDKNYSSWSNIVTMPVISPLPAPEVHAEATAAGYKLTWQSEGEGVKYDVFRKSLADAKPVQIASVETPDYVDTTSQWDTPYTYTVTAAKGSAESLPSEPVYQNHPDTFPPAMPQGVAASVAADSIELSWQRNTESDLKGYFVYRSVGGSALERQNGLVNIPAFSDHAVEHGKTYRYQVSAIDQKDNEGDKSAPV
ncbi:MAG: hypothetical protein JO061_04950, partial [Acidobacteriaceae bacterium]|nr:hypothetical protein [Acidobacteriaceae bacterium]